MSPYHRKEVEYDSDDSVEEFEDSDRSKSVKLDGYHPERLIGKVKLPKPKPKPNTMATNTQSEPSDVDVAVAVAAPAASSAPATITATVDPNLVDTSSDEELSSDDYAGNENATASDAEREEESVCVVS